ncbi:MAG: hypothetical protein M1831_006115 [Alyxoria varia]|nr:MAG: hypothetical protein M1831_006115 [Alyxoria varia]
MALDARTAEQLIQKLTDDRNAYLESVNKTHELLLQVINSTAHGAPSNSPKPNLTTDLIQKQNAANLEVDSVNKDLGSTLAPDSDDDENESVFAQSPLPREEYSMEGFRTHLRNYRWTDPARKVLEGVMEDGNIMSQRCLFPNEKGPVADRSHLSHYSIFDVGPDGAPLQLRMPEAADTSRAMAIWNRLKGINTTSNRERSAVGRITIVREPSPILFAALHYTMNKHFDVDELFDLLVDDNPILTHPHRAFDDDNRHARSFVVTMEYFTIVDKGCKPMSWQMADRTDTNSESLVPISRCSSVIALSLEGERMGRVRNRDRKIDKRYGDIYDPFSPWRVLNIQAYPDLRSSIDAHDSTKHYVNGPEAFLVTLRAEYRDVRKRLSDVHKRISALIEPSSNFMFDEKERDAMLFEDEDYTYSRRYFWAYQSIVIMNQDIHGIVTSYKESFKDSVWDGSNKIIWPGEATQSSRYAQWRKRMKRMREDLDDEMSKLIELSKLNEGKMKEITSLRDNLFSGTSVHESRQSVTNSAITVEQGRNIKLLTLVTIFFLPLTFVTSVFGMSAFPSDGDFDHFAWTVVCVCLPTYFLIGSLNSQAGLDWWTRQTRVFYSYVGRGLTWFLALFNYQPRWAEHIRLNPEPEHPRTRRYRPRPARTYSTDMTALTPRDTFNGMPQLSPRMTSPDGQGQSSAGRAEQPSSMPLSSNERNPTLRFDLQQRQTEEMDPSTEMLAIRSRDETPDNMKVEANHTNTRGSVTESEHSPSLLSRFFRRSRTGQSTKTSSDVP